MSIENILNKDIDRRELFTGTAKAAVGLAGTAYGLESLIAFHPP
jgi:hypothetical protein